MFVLCALDSRLNAMGLLVALSSAPEHTAHGSLFWDDGEAFGQFGLLTYLGILFYSFKIRIIVIPRLHDTAGCQTGFVLNEQPLFLQPVVKPV